MSFQGCSHTTPDILSEAVAENATCLASLNTVDLLCFCSLSRHTVVKLQAFILVQKESVILLVTLSSYYRMLISQCCLTKIIQLLLL